MNKHIMEDIFKSGLLGLAFIATMAFAAIHTNESKSSNNKYTQDKIKEVSKIEKDVVVKENKLKDKEDFYIPL